MTVLCAGPAGADEMAAMVETSRLRMAIGSDGRVVEFVDKQSGLNYVADRGSACAWVRKAGQLQPATALAVADGQWQLRFAESDVAVLLPSGSAAACRLGSCVVNGEDIEEFVFCDVPLTLQGMPAEPFAACALALNLKTNVAELPRPASRLRAVCYPKFGCVGAAVAIVAVRRRSCARRCRRRSRRHPNCRIRPWVVPGHWTHRSIAAPTCSTSTASPKGTWTNGSPWRRAWA